MRKIFTLRLSPVLHNKLSNLAELHQRSMAGELRWLIASAETNQSVCEQYKVSEIDSLKKEETNALKS